MNNGYHATWGLYLPFRFYLGNRLKISEFSDFGKLLSIPTDEFLIMPNGRILPFQVVRETIGSVSYTLHYYCIDTEEEIDMSGFLSGLMNTTADIDGYQWISFEGIDDTLGLDSGGYFAVFRDGTNEWFSENFFVMGDAWTETYRKWSDNDINIRTTGEELRII